MNVKVGINGRFFTQNWRPAAQELTFCQHNQFKAIQIAIRDEAITPTKVGCTFAELKELATQAQVEMVVELNVLVNEQGQTAAGLTPLQVLDANLPFIEALNCPAVHWHLVPHTYQETADYYQKLEASFFAQAEQAVKLGQQHHFRFGVEHNEAQLRLFATPAAFEPLFEAVPGCGFVWDFNHVAPAEFPAYASFAPRVSMLHLSDTLWPQVNYHLPIGQGNLNFAPFWQALQAAGFNGIGILEIGGLPKSGGYGKDTDEALCHSAGLIRQQLQHIQQE